MASPTKQALRQQMLKARSQFPSEERRTASATIQQSILKSWKPHWKLVLLYANQQEEVATDVVIAHLLKTGTRVCIPYWDSTQKVYLPSEIKDFTSELETARMGILEPKSAARRPISTSELDAIFLPGLAFDRSGNRVGYGRGYFDRICHNTRAEKIGLAFHFQLVEGIISHSHDVAMNLIITEQEMITCPNL
jgi:5-formyltetrahydrofolate cyclo-ligase